MSHLRQLVFQVSFDANATVTAACPEFAAWFGRSCAELVGRSAREWVCPTHWEMYRRLLRHAVTRGQSITWATAIVRPDDTVHLCQITAEPLVSSADTLVIGTFRVIQLIENSTSGDDVLSYIEDLSRELASMSGRHDFSCLREQLEAAAGQAAELLKGSRVELG